ncbi:AlpA family phage regulatory protein [Pseudoxanthomonas indica]|uniref:helix-turn-helix transcriptional regulator n=1 Tax=Pseudoxanthomonas indica TaxID=428993 RepID=UPI0009A62693
MQHDRLIREKEVLRLIGYSRTTFRSAWSGGRFPKGIKHGGMRLWSEQEVQAWIQVVLADRENVSGEAPC